MLTAYIDAMGRFATFRGRSSRSQFWLYNLSLAVLFVVCLVIDVGVLGRAPEGVLPVTGLFNLLHLLPSLAVTVRRLHDTDRSGCWASSPSSARWC